MMTQKRTATKTPNNIPLFCFYLMLFTIWAVVPARADTVVTNTTYNSVGQVAAEQTTTRNEIYRAPESTRIRTTYNSKGQVESVVVVETNSAQANDGVSRNSYFGGRSLTEKDLASEQASED